jgi:hypothetical protein
VWNGPLDTVRADVRDWHDDSETRLRIVPFEVNSLLNRFHPRLAVTTDAVVYLDDDDAPPSVLLLKLGFATWQCDPLRIAYLNGRGIVNGQTDLGSYRIPWYMPNSDWSAHANAGRLVLRIKWR